jgi:uncharacterized protein YdeI (BOF family)
MLKKIVVVTFFLALIGALMAGAVIRTSDRVNRTAETSYRQGRSNEELAFQASGGRWQSSEQDAAVANGGRGRGGSTANDAALANWELGIGQAEVDEWITLEGTVRALDDSTMSVTTVEGETVTVENRAWSFAQEEGFSVQPGDRVRLTGFYEDGDLEVGTIENLSNGTQVELRDESGRPLWAGRGRRGT